MSITLIVAKSSNQAGDEIGLEDWLNIVSQDCDLRLQTGSIRIRNPKTEEQISIKPLPGQTELAVGKEHVPFLGYRNGRLVMSYSSAFNETSNPVRNKVADIARRLGAIIRHDAGDEILNW